MALLYADGFEDGLTDWALTQSPVTTTTNARNGFSVTCPGGGSSSYIARSFPAVDTVCIGFAYRTSSIAGWTTPDNRQVFLTLYGDGGATAHSGLFQADTGALHAVRSPISTPVSLGATAAGIITSNAWYYIEIQTTLHDTTGTFIIRVNGTTVLNLSGVDTKNAGTASTYDRLRFGSASTSVVYLFDDVYVLDTTGSTSNTFLGDLAVEHIRPIGNDTSQWVGSDADSVNNYALVNEVGAPVTTTYTGSAVVGNRDLYTTPGSVRGIGTIHGVYAVANMAKSDAGAKSAALCIKQGAGGTPRTGTSQALTTGYLNYGQAYDRKADGSAWTFADLQALRIGAEVTA